MAWLNMASSTVSPASGCSSALGERLEAKDRPCHTHFVDGNSNSPRAKKPAKPRSMQISVDHLTEYRYDRPVRFGEHSLFLRPRESQTIHVRSFSLRCTPEGKVRWMRDCFNNVVAVASFGTVESAMLSFHCQMAFDVAVENPFDFILDPRASEFPFTYDDREQSALRPYREPEESERGSILDWLRSAGGVSTAQRDTLSFLTDLNFAVHRSIAYEHRDEEGTQTPSQTLERAMGSCRDMAELFVATSRELGLAARFVSGYLYEPARADGSVAFNRAAGSMHAWAEVYLPGAGWRGFDPTNGLLTDHRFLPSAVANKPKWVNPIQGQYFQPGGVRSQMNVHLQVSGSDD
jgi:transglutaminase-like putative cysteine protease